MNRTEKGIFAVFVVALFIGAIYYFETREVITTEQGMEMALEHNDPSYCEKINKTEVVNGTRFTKRLAREMCRVNFAVETEDVDYCLSLSAEPNEYKQSAMDSCLKFLANKLGRTDLCEMMPIVTNDPVNGSTWLTNCMTMAEMSPRHGEDVGESVEGVLE